MRQCTSTGTAIAAAITNAEGGGQGHQGGQAGSSGAGAAVLACLDLWVDIGLPLENITATDLAGVVTGRVGN